jgi:hypothetical protein
MARATQAVCRDAARRCARACSGTVAATAPSNVAYTAMARVTAVTRELHRHLGYLEARAGAPHRANV